MSRNAIQIGYRALQQHTLHSISLNAASFRPVLAAISAPSFRYLTSRPLQLRQLSSRSVRTHRNASTTNTKPVWLGSTAPIASQLGLRRTSHLQDRAFSISESLAARRVRIRETPKRRFSEEKKAGVAKTSEAAQKTGQSPGGAKSIPQKAAGATASKTLLDRLPHIHAPTKYELLATATGFWSRLRINFKWFSIRSLRPYTLDEIGAFVSWIFLGHVLWIIIGTTTFVSLGIWALNTVFAQETLAGWVGNYLTKSSGLKVVFESAIVPTWRSGVITFNNVFVSRHPGQHAKTNRNVEKGSATTAAAAASAALAGRSSETSNPEDDGNYSQFDVTMETVNVTLSFSKWFNGKGLLRDVEIVGVRGVIDRTSVQPRDYSIDPKSYRHEHDTGDFEIEHFKMSDVLLTVHQPANFRPFTVSVFNCDLPRLRKQWLFYDFMSANNMSGSFDESLFTVHPRQVHGSTGAQLIDGAEDGDHQWKKYSRLRIDGLNIDHLNRGVEGPFSWIREGNVDLVADVMIPSDDDNIWRQSWKKSTEAMSDFYEKMEAAVSKPATHEKSRYSEQVIDHSVEAPSNSLVLTQSADERHQQPCEADKRFVVFDIKVHLNDVRASVPFLTRDLSYVNNALVRPIVAYINSRRAFIPVNCRVVKRQSEFDGSWTIFDSGLLDDLSRETYEACARDIEDVGARKRRMKTVGLWTVQLAVQALFLGLAGQLA